MKPYIIYLKADIDVASERRKARAGELDNVEKEGDTHQQKVAANFERLLEDKSFYHQLWIVDANQDKEGVKRQLKDITVDIIRNNVARIIRKMKESEGHLVGSH